MKNDSNNAAKQMIARYPDLKPYPEECRGESAPRIAGRISANYILGSL